MKRNFQVFVLFALVLLLFICAAIANARDDFWPEPNKNEIHNSGDFAWDFWGPANGYQAEQKRIQKKPSTIHPLPSGNRHRRGWPILMLESGEDGRWSFNSR